MLEKVITHIKNIFEIVRKYIGCTIIDSFIIGIANYIFMLCMGMPWKVLISVLIGITNIVPNFGPIVGALIGGIVIAFYDIHQTLWFLLFTIILQTIDGLLIKPKLFGKSFGISGIWMLLGMIIGGAILGVVGFVLAPPMVAIIRYIIKDIIMKK